MDTVSRTVGRPPGPHDDTLAKLLPTALRLFTEEGGAALTPTRLHKETGVARATIYRNWPEPADLIEIMLGYATEQPSQDRFTGDLRKDLYVAVDVLIDRFDNRPARAFFAACLEYGRNSERVAAAAEEFVSAMLASFRFVLEQGIEAGSLTGPLDDLVSEVAGPLLLEHVVMGRRVTRNRGRGVVDHFLEHHVT